MVSVASFFAMLITLIISILYPVFLYIMLRRRSSNVTGAVIAGAVAFYISQILIRLPLIQVVLPEFDWFVKLKDIPVSYILFFASSAALFEETARYLAFVLLLKEKQVWKCGIAFGIGHGGIEAVMLVGITYINNIALSFMINSGTFYINLQNKLDNEAAGQIYKALTQTSADTFLAAGIERALTIIVHIALSVMILEGIIRSRRLLFYFAAIIAHTVLNYVSSYMAFKMINMWLIELFIAGMAALSILYVVKSKKRFGDRIEAVDEAKKAVEEGY